MKKAFKCCVTFVAILSILLTSVVVNGEGLNKVTKKWNFLADAYKSGNAFPTSNSYKDLDGNAVWSTFVYSNDVKTAMKPVSANSGITPAMWSKDGSATGAPLIQIRPVAANMCRITPAASGAPLLRWTSNIKSNVKVTAQVMKEATGGDGTTLVLIRNSSVIEQVSVAASDITLKQIIKTISVDIGDTVEIAVLANTNSTGDVSTLNLIIEEIDSISFDAVPKFSYTYCGEEVGTITAGGTVNATLGASNLSQVPADMIGVLAVYSQDNVLLGVGLDKVTALASGQSVTLNCHIEDYTPQDYQVSDFKIRMFVWNSLSELTPLYKGFSYPPTEKRVWKFEEDNAAMGYPSFVPFGDVYGATKVWNYGMGNHSIINGSRPYDFRALTYDTTANIWYNNEDPKISGVTYNFPYIKIDRATGQSALQTRSRTTAQQTTEGTTNARLHPIVRFISPIDGQITVDITLTKKMTGGDGLYFMMGINGNIPAEYAALITAGANAATTSKSVTLTVEKGMCVDFMLHGLSDNGSDESRLQIAIKEQ